MASVRSFATFERPSQTEPVAWRGSSVHLESNESEHRSWKSFLSQAGVSNVSFNLSSRIPPYRPQGHYALWTALGATSSLRRESWTHLHHPWVVAPRSRPRYRVDLSPSIGHALRSFSLMEVSKIHTATRQCRVCNLLLGSFARIAQSSQIFFLLSDFNPGHTGHMADCSSSYLDLDLIIEFDY